jgi:hypothetical protein
MALSICSVKVLITEGLNGEQTGSSAIARGALQKHTSQRNRHHHPSCPLQIVLKMYRSEGDIFAQNLLLLFHKKRSHLSKGYIHALGRS